MKRLAFLGFTIATLIAPIQVQAQQSGPGLLQYHGPCRAARVGIKPE